MTDDSTLKPASIKSASIKPAPVKRVLYVVSLFPCWSETFIVREIQTLLADGVDVRILSLKPASETLVQADARDLLERTHYPATGVTGAIATLASVVRHPIASVACVATIVADMWRTPIIMLKSLVALARGLRQVRWLNEFDPQLIHAHWATYPSTVAWALARVSGRKFGFTCHAHDIFLDPQLLATKIGQAALAVTISRYNIDWLAQRVSAQARDKFAVVHCGVDMRRTILQLDGRSPNHIVAVGRLDPIKGFDVLIDALHRLHERGIEFRCTVIGEGPLRPELEAQSRARAIGELIRWVGALPQEVVQKTLRDAAIFALPCQVAADGNRDGIPVALMEAMASGCAVATTAVSGVPELVVDDVTGLVVAQRDAPALADALQRLLADAMLRRRLASAARVVVEREFDARTEARKLRQLMSGAVETMDVKRLLVVIDEMEVGGSQRQVVHMLAGLDRNRWQPELVYFRERSFLIDELEQVGVRIHHIPKRGRIDLRFMFALARVLRHGRYDVIHAFSLTAELWTVMASHLLLRRPPLIGSIRGLYLHQSRRFWWLKGLALSRCAAVVSNSRAGADVAARLGGHARSRIDVIGNGVPIPDALTAAARENLREHLGVVDGRCLALFVGRLVDQKNIACLLDALAMLPASRRPVLALAGDGPLRMSLSERADALGIRDQVRFLGERADTTQLMQAADMLILPSHEEGLSNALLEAMAAGCPVIASAVGGNLELIDHEHTGLLFPDDSRVVLAEAMSRLIDDPVLRQRLSQQALQKVERQHSIAALVKATQAVYERCIDAHTLQHPTSKPASGHPLSTSESDHA